MNLDALKAAISTVSTEATNVINAEIKAGQFGNLKALASVSVQLDKLVARLEKRNEPKAAPVADAPATAAPAAKPAAPAPAKK